MMILTSLTTAFIISLCSLPIGSWGQAYVNPASTQQMSTTNPAPDPNGCDADTFSGHLNSVTNSLTSSLSSDGGASDVVNYVLQGRNMSNPANSCSDIYNFAPSNSPSGYYWLRNQADGTAVSVYCNMDITCSCSSQRGWTRVAVFDMANPSTNCPSQWRTLQASGKRACGKGFSGWGWSARAHSLQGVPYRRVCGKVIGYLYGSPDTYNRWNSQKWRTVNEVYMDGVDIVYGHYNPQTNANNYNHVWTNAAAINDYGRQCPCQSGSTRLVPTFVGNNQYCEGGQTNNNWHPPTLRTADPLWDGMGCSGVEAPCCTTGAPWFCRNITAPTTEDLVIRLMTDQGWGDEDVTVRSYELYVQ